MRAKRVRCPYDDLVLAERRGRRAAKANKSLKDNPYPTPTVITRGQYPCGAWVRGWIAAQKKKG